MRHRIASILILLVLVLTACSLAPIEETEEVVSQNIAQQGQNNLEVTDEPNFNIIEVTEEPETTEQVEIEVIDRTNTDSGANQAGGNTGSGSTSGGTTSSGGTSSGGTTKGGQQVTDTHTSCTNQLQFISDVSVPDGTNIQAGATFTKTWRVRNAGTCTWDSRYSFRQTSGTKITFSSYSHPTVPIVFPGQTVDLSVSLRLSSNVANGQAYRADFNLFDPWGKSFGSNVFVLVHAYVYQAPPPSCTNHVTVVSAPSSITVLKGQQFNATWTLRNSGNCTWHNYAFTRTGGDYLTVSYGTGVGLPTVAPGQTVQVTVPLIVPTNAAIQSGTATSYFRMQSSSGAFFGGTIAYSVNVQHVPPTCTNSYQITAVPNSITVQRDQNFNAVWTLQNTGTCTWGGYSFLQVNSTGLQLQSSNTVTIPSTPPGGSVQVTVPLVVPNSATVNNNTASITFRVITGQSVQFGGEFTYSVTVQENPQCTNSLSVVNAPPTQTVDAGDTFSVSVTLQNTGTCNWSNYRLVQSANNGVQLNGVSQVIIPSTNAGNNVTFSVPLAVPALYVGNTASGTFRVQTGGGTNFGQELNYSVTVNQVTPCTDGANTVSIPASQTVDPGDTFNINVTLANTGDCDWSGYSLIQSADNGLQLNGTSAVGIPNTNGGNNVQISIPLTVLGSYTGTSASGSFQVVSNTASAVGTSFDYVVTVNQPCTPNFTPVSLPASQTVDPGDSFNVSLTLNNNGTCDWAGYSLVQTANNGLQLDSVLTVAIPNTTVGNNTTPLSIPLTVPVSFTGNTASGSFRIQDDMGTQFGQTLTYSVTVNQTCTPNFSVVSAPASQTVNPGDTFNISLTLNNNGTCDWAGYSLVQTANNGLQLDSVLTVPVPNTTAGNNATFNVPLTVPALYVGNTASGSFRIQDDMGTQFGQTLDYSVTVTQPVACTDSFSVVTAPATQTVTPGQAFNVSLTVNNNGTCDWTNYRLVSSTMNGLQFNGFSSVTFPATTAGNNATISVPLLVPSGFTGTTATANFSIQNAEGVNFGANLPYSVTVDQPVVACTYDSLFIEDTTVPDGSTVPVDTDFTKTWLVQNTGTCPWEDMALVLLTEDVTNIEVVSDGLTDPYTIPVLAPNAQGGVSIELRIPAGTPVGAAAQARFRLQDSNGNLFGAILFIDALAGS